MNSLIGWCIGALLAFLAGWGGLQKRKVYKATERAREAEQRAKAAELNLKVAETAAKTKDKIAEAQKANQEKKESVNLQIMETEKEEDPDEKKKDQERIANGITDLFNARNTAR